VLVDRRHNLHRFVTGSAGAIPCHSDAEAVRLACKEARNPRCETPVHPCESRVERAGAGGPTLHWPLLSLVTTTVAA
jgi:hypothetical protein